MNLLATILISSAIAVTSFLGAYKYMPVSWLDSPLQNLGSTITSMAGSDTLSSSRAVINTNFTNLNTDKIEATVTTLSSLSSIGTITTGVWNGTAVGATWGGTGSTTLSQYSILLGSTTNPIGIVQGLGSSGQFLTSQGAGLPPNWTTGTFNTASDYILTGLWVFQASTTHATTTTRGLIASSTPAQPIVLNGLPYSTPSTRGASSTVLYENASGALVWMQPEFHKVAERILQASTGTTTITVPSRQDYIISVFATSSATAGFAMQVNSDTGRKYDYSRNLAGGVLGAIANTNFTLMTGINMFDTATHLQAFGRIEVTGVAAGVKLVTWNLVGGSLVGSPPDNSIGGGYYKDTSGAVTSFSFGGQGVNFEAGTRFTIYASSI